MAYAKRNMNTASIFWDEQLCPTISLIHSSSKKLEKCGKKVREKERQLKSKHKDKWKSKYEEEVGYISEEIMTLITIYNALNKEDEEKDKEAGFQRNSQSQSFNQSRKRPHIQKDDENVKTIKLLEERVESLQSQLKSEKQEQKDRRKSFEVQFKPSEPEESFERRNRSYQSDPPSKRFNRHECEEKVKTLEEIVRQLNADKQDLQQRNLFIRHECEEIVRKLQENIRQLEAEKRDQQRSSEEQLQNFQTNEPKEGINRRNPSYQSAPPSKRFNRHEYEKKVKTLEETVRQLNADKQDLQSRVESLQSQMKNEKQEQKDRRSSFEDQFKANEPEESFEKRNRSNQSDPPRHEYEEKVKTFEEIVRQLTADNEVLQQSNRSIRHECEETVWKLQENIRQLKAEKWDQQRSFEEQLQNLQTNEPKGGFYRRNPSHQSDPPSKRFNRHEYEKKLKTLEETVRQLNADKQDLQSRSKKRIAQLEEEKLDLQTRLSAVIGSRIKDGNPDIADLSDENRPTKLAEMLSELYDNEWTDCFEESIETKCEEYGREKELLKILMDIFNVCFEWSTEKYFLHIQRAIDRTYLDGKHCSDEKAEVVLPKDLQQPIKEFKKKRALQVLPTIHRLVKNRLPEYSHDRFATTAYRAYIQQCIKFSWLAVVQDPPMALNAEGGTAFNKKQFKEYMCRGEYVEFVVWPSLHLTSGGNLLAKGVAQGTNRKATAL